MMTTRVVYELPLPRKAIALVCEDGEQIGIIAREPWLFWLILECIANYWSGETNRGRTPEQMAREAVAA